MTTSSQDESRRRSATRAPIGRPIKLQFDDSMDLIEGHCHNISIGGMFIVFEHTRQPGSLVRFELDLGDNNAIRGLGEVVWMRPKSNVGGPEAGLGLKFRFLEQRDRQLIFKLVSQHIKDRLSKREPVSSPAEEIMEPPPPQGLQAAESEPSLIPLANGGVQRQASPDDPTLQASEPPLEPPIETATVTPSIEDAAAMPNSSDPRTDRATETTPPGEQASGADLTSAEAVDLDPSVGDTPIYELGLDHSPHSDQRPSFFQEPVGSDLEESPDADESASLSASVDAIAGDEPREEIAQAPVPGLSGKREFAILPVIAILLIAGAAGFYLFKDEILSKLGREPSTVGSGAAPDPVAESQSTTTDQYPEPSVAATPAPPPPVVEDVPPPPNPTAAPEITARSVETPPSTTPEKLPPRQTPSSVAKAPVASKPPPPSAPARGKQGGFTRLLDVSWSTTASGLKVVLAADGPIPTGRYSYFRLPGETTREVVKLTGVRHGLATRHLAVDAPGIQQIRVGFHPKPREIHVVIDLANPGWKIVEVRNLGTELEVLLESG